MASSAALFPERIFTQRVHVFRHFSILCSKHWTRDPSPAQPQVWKPNLAHPAFFGIKARPPAIGHALAQGKNHQL